MPERDVNEEASRLVRELTESKPVNGEDLIESEELKRQFREAKERLSAESAPGSIADTSPLGTPTGQRSSFPLLSS